MSGYRIRQTGRRGFTLIELLVVLSVIGVLAWIPMEGGVANKLACDQSRITLEFPRSLDRSCFVIQELSPYLPHGQRKHTTDAYSLFDNPDSPVIREFARKSSSYLRSPMSQDDTVITWMIIPEIA